MHGIAGIRILFVSTENALMPFSFSLTMGCSSDMAEYEAITAGLELVLQIQITNLTIYCDSELNGQATTQRVQCVEGGANFLPQASKKKNTYTIRRSKNNTRSSSHVCSGRCSSRTGSFSLPQTEKSAL